MRLNLKDGAACCFGRNWRWKTGPKRARNSSAPGSPAYNCSSASTQANMFIHGMPLNGPSVRRRTAWSLTPALSDSTISAFANVCRDLVWFCGVCFPAPSFFPFRFSGFPVSFEGSFGPLYSFSSLPLFFLMNLPLQQKKMLLDPQTNPIVKEKKEKR